MEQEIINNVYKIFDTPEKWNSFLDLFDLKEKIENNWNSKLLQRIQEKITLPNEWAFNTNGKVWHLKDFDIDSLSIWLEGEYFSIYADPVNYNIDLLKSKLRDTRYKAVLDCIIIKDSESLSSGYLIREKGKFVFDTIYDNNFDAEHLAWYAGNETV